MKIAIHHRKIGFSERWIEYCKNKNIPFKLVNAFDTDIIAQLKDCQVLMWHHSHINFEETIAAQSILTALEHAGVKVFPDHNTAWHFDNKIAQKYLLEAIGAPLVTSYVFYDKKKALSWVEKTDFPKVFKLKNGAGSKNVRLVHSKQQAIKLINKSFGKGFLFIDKWNYLKELKYKKQASLPYLVDVIRGLKRGLFPKKNRSQFQNERGYIYFQDFMPNNDSDTRVIVIGDKAFAVKRMVRENDFRASGSGNAFYDKGKIDLRCVKIAFEINAKIGAQSIGYDFVFDHENNPLIVEIGYGFKVEFYDLCPGYWDKNMTWHERKFMPQEWMIDNILKHATS